MIPNQIAQSSPAPQVLPFPGPGAGPIFKDQLPPEVLPGMMAPPPIYRAHGDACIMPPFRLSQETLEFMENCPLGAPGAVKGFFLDPQHPECSCSAFHELFPDYLQINMKLFNKALLLGAGEYGAIFFTLMLLLVGFLLWLPIGYFLSIRRIKRRLEVLKDSDRFYDWHERLWTRNLALILVISGLLMIAYSIQGEAVLEVGQIIIKTNFIGLAICLLGVVLWLRLGARGLARQVAQAKTPGPDRES